MCKYICLVKSLQFYEIWRQVDEVRTVANVQNTVVLRQVMMSKHCILSHALLCYCTFLLDYAPFHVKEENVFLWWRITGVFPSALTLRLGAIQMPKAYKLFQLRAHPQFLICCPVGQMFSLHGGKESTQRFQLSRVSKCEATWQRARPIPTSLLL